MNEVDLTSAEVILLMEMIDDEIENTIDDSLIKDLEQIHHKLRNLK